MGGVTSGPADRYVVSPRKGKKFCSNLGKKTLKAGLPTTHAGTNIGNNKKVLRKIKKGVFFLLSRMNCSEINTSFCQLSNVTLLYHVDKRGPSCLGIFIYSCISGKTQTKKKFVSPFHPSLVFRRFFLYIHRQHAGLPVDNK